MTKYRDTIVGAIVILIAVGLFAATFGIREFTRTSVGAGFLPRITAGIFCLLGVVLIVRERRRNRLVAEAPRVPDASVSAPPAVPVGLTGPVPVILNILLFVGYLALLDRVGFVIMTTLYLFFQMVLLTNPARRRFGVFLVLSVVVSVVSYYVFVTFFTVMLPPGLLD